MLICLGGLTIAFTGMVPPMWENSFLPAFVVPHGRAEITVRIYHDPVVDLPEDVLYEDTFYRVHSRGSRLWVECSSFGELKTWAYGILHIDRNTPDQCSLQVLLPNSTFHMENVLSSIMMESLLLAHHRAILHASVIQVEGQAILFSAPSGTGKSTQAELWRRYRGAEIVNGDRVLLCSKNGQELACGLPYAGTSGICKNFALPIRAIVVLSQGKENVAQRMRPSAAVPALLGQISMQKWNDQDIHRALNVVERLILHLPVYHLACLPDVSAVECLQAALEERNA